MVLLLGETKIWFYHWRKYIFGFTAGGNKDLVILLGKKDLVLQLGKTKIWFYHWGKQRLELWPEASGA